MKEECGFPAHRELPDFMRKQGYDPKEMVRPRSSRRALFHDYCTPGYYMITATATPSSLPLSAIPEIPAPELTKGEMIIPDHTPLGELIRKEITEIPVHHPEIRIIRFVVMPDHIHIVLEVKEKLTRKLGRVLAGFFGACSTHHTRLAGSSELKTLFQPFHDRILMNINQLDRAVKYVADNPRRFMIRRKYPDLFRRYLHLEINGHEYAAYGNIFLLKEIQLMPVRIHRRWTEAEFRKYEHDCLMAIENGAIPISPAIHKAEKAIMNKAIEGGGSVIQMTDQGFEDRFKPKGRKFDLCAQGRLLLLAPWPDNTGRKSTAGFKEFHQMNDLAKAIASLPADARLSLKRN